MEIEVGEYVRTIDGYIRRIDNINKEKKDITYHGKYIIDYPYKNSQSVNLKKIKKHSKNIIDLIEVGDYVNGMLIVQVMKETFEGNKRTRIFANRDEKCMLKAVEITKIDTILTHEIYEKNCYKIGE